MQISIDHVYETLWHHNILSGHHWSTPGKFLYYEVSGGFFTTTRHKKLKNAIKERDEHKEFIRKYPFCPPLSKREVLL